MTGKKRGPVPKPKPEVFAWVDSAHEIGDYDGSIVASIKIAIKANSFSSHDDFRKAAKKAIDKYFKEL
jgi:hypothetical protein